MKDTPSILCSDEGAIDDVEVRAGIVKKSLAAMAFR